MKKNRRMNLSKQIDLVWHIMVRSPCSGYKGNKNMSKDEKKFHLSSDEESTDGKSLREIFDAQMEDHMGRFVDFYEDSPHPEHDFEAALSLELDRIFKKFRNKRNG